MRIINLFLPSIPKGKSLIIITQAEYTSKYPVINLLTINHYLIALPITQHRPTIESNCKHDQYAQWLQQISERICF